MLCDRCHKNEATIHIKELHNQQWKTVNLCAGCAAKMDESGTLGNLGLNLAEMIFKLGQPEAGLSQTDKKAAGTPPPPADFPECPHCHWSVAKINESGGKMGCPDCYRHFGTLLEGVFSRVQHGNIHLGKRPELAGSPANVRALKFELEKLQKALQEAVKREEYEHAATCRDQIRHLQTLLKNQGKQ